MKIERYFQIIAVIHAGIAVFFLWQGNTDGLWVSVVLGAVAFFFSIRFQAKERIRIRQEQAELEEAERIPTDTEEPAEEAADDDDPTRTT